MSVRECHGILSFSWIMYSHHLFLHTNILHHSSLDYNTFSISQSSQKSVNFYWIHFTLNWSSSKYYNNKFKPNYEFAEAVSNNVKRLLAPNPSPFTFHGTGTYIIGNKEIAIIEPGPRIESHVKNLLNIIDKDNIIHIG